MMNMTEECIARTLRNTTLHADTYTQDVLHALSNITDTVITWDEAKKTFNVCEQIVAVGYLDPEHGTIAFTINGKHSDTVLCSVVEKEAIMIDALKHQIIEEEQLIEQLTNNIEKLSRDDARHHTLVSVYSRSTGLEVDTDDISTNTVETIIDLVRRDLEDVREEKYRIIKELNERIAQMNKVWEWSISTNSLWADFDNGTIEALTYEEALIKATDILHANIKEVNALLGGKYTISVDASNIELTEIK